MTHASFDPCSHQPQNISTSLRLTCPHGNTQAKAQLLAEREKAMEEEAQRKISNVKRQQTLIEDELAKKKTDESDALQAAVAKHRGTPPKEVNDPAAKHTSTQSDGNKDTLADMSQRFAFSSAWLQQRTQRCIQSLMLRLSREQDTAQKTKLQKEKPLVGEI